MMSEMRRFQDVFFDFTGSKYFTLGIVGNYIVEINPGECFDRGGNTHSGMVLRNICPRVHVIEYK